MVEQGYMSLGNGQVQNQDMDVCNFLIMEWTALLLCTV